MSNAPKQSILRLIVPEVISTRALNSLGPEAKVDAKEMVLKSGRLTTGDIVRYIKEYTKFRVELLQTLRQLGIDREGKPRPGELPDLDSTMREAEDQLGEIRSKYQKLQMEIDSLQRQGEDAKRQIATIEQLADTGFSYDEMASGIPGFRRILGRLPVKKLEPAQKALHALLKERTVTATGAKRRDWVYLLVATPTDAAPQALQTLLLYEFIPTDMPIFEGSNLKESLDSWKERCDKTTSEAELRRAETKILIQSATESLNRLADEIQEIILTLRSFLRLGEGTSVAHIYAHLEKPLSPETLNALGREGVLEVESK